MSQNRFERQLLAGIRAAQQGNRERARELLEGVLRQDRNNEQAWIWLASIVETDRERRLSLERILKINPNNRPAQSALNSMVGVLGGGSSEMDFEAMSRAARTPIPTRSGGSGSSGASAPSATNNDSSGNNTPVLLLGGVAVILAIVLLVSFVPGLLGGNQPEPTAVVVAETSTPSETPDPLFTPPTSTIVPSPTFDGTLVSVTRESTLPPTFTPTATGTATNTPPPTATLPALADFDFVVVGRQGSANPAIYTVGGDGSGLRPLITDVEEMDYYAESDLLVFTRPILVAQPTLAPTNTPEATPTIAGTLPPTPFNNNSQDDSSSSGIVVDLSVVQLPDVVEYQMFVTSLSDPSAVRELTRSTFQNVYSPSISPDGMSIAVASDNDGDSEIYIYDVATDIFTRVTDNIGINDTDPSWSPDGTQLVFASERETPGRTELYIVNPFAENPEATVERITDGRGSNIQPEWSPVTDEIAYLNQTNDNTSIRVTTVSRQSVTTLTFNPDWSFAVPSWTVSGEYVLYASAAPDDNTREIRAHVPGQRNPLELNIVNLDVIAIVQR